jgi:hypothetical protein
MEDNLLESSDSSSVLVVGAAVAIFGLVMVECGMAGDLR